MPHLPHLVGVAALVSGVVAIEPTAFADENRSKAICQSVDEGAPQRIGDREGHMMAIYDVTCRVVEGQPSGGVSSGKVIIEWDKTHATLIAGGGVLKSPGAIAVFQNMEENGDATVVDGQIWVTAFGRFDASRGWVGDVSLGAGFLRNLTTGQEIGGLSHPHSPRWAGGTWTVCNSLEGTVVTWDPAGARWERRIELEKYPRGLVVDDRMLYVGESANRGHPDERAALAVVEDDRVVDRIPLPAREIYDVVVAPRALVDGLRRGFNTNPHRVAAAVADDLLGSVGARELFAGIGYPVDTTVTSTQVSCRPPATVARSAVVPLHVEVTNLSEAALASVPPYPVCLSYRWRGPDGVETDGPRTMLGRVLFRDDTGSYTIDLEAPATPGGYQLTVCLVQEGFVWFDGIGPSNASVTPVTVT